jgi:DNA-binding NtrC family response regulator
MSRPPSPPAGTAIATARATAPLPSGLRLIVSRGPDRGKNVPLPSTGGTVIVGTDATGDLVVTDPLVSRRHLEIVVHEHDLVARDLGSRNGSFFEGARFESLRLDLGATIRVGDSELQVRPPEAADAAPGATAFGAFLGGRAMRELFAKLDRVASSDAAVLLQGETGTGKDLVAEAVHRHSRRSAGPFVICDLGGVSAGLIESELFGHVKGAFTGADRDRNGAFALASGGTIFLDEVGELSLDLQPRLLRVLERRQVKRVGSGEYHDVDVRIVAATNRDLGAEVRAGHFRRDLFHRLSVVDVHLPPLRQRTEDIPALVDHFVGRFAAEAGRPSPVVTPEAMAALVSHSWPGNIRELRNVIERAMAISAEGDRLGPRLFGLGEDSEPKTDDSVPFKEAKDRLIHVWEREYLRELLAKAGGNVTLAARKAGLARQYLHDLLEKHGITR